MDLVVFNDGGGFLSDLDEGGKIRIGYGNFWDTIGIKCLVVVFIFWGRVARAGLRGDNGFVDSYRGDNTGIWESFQDGGVAAGSVSFLGKLCLGFKRRYFSAEQIILLILAGFDNV